MIGMEVKVQQLAEDGFGRGEYIVCHAVGALRLMPLQTRLVPTC